MEYNKTYIPSSNSGPYTGPGSGMNGAVIGLPVNYNSNPYIPPDNQGRRLLGETGRQNAIRITPNTPFSVFNNSLNPNYGGKKNKKFSKKKSVRKGKNNKKKYSRRYRKK